VLRASAHTEEGKGGGKKSSGANFLQERKKRLKRKGAPLGGKWVVFGVEKKETRNAVGGDDSLLRGGKNQVGDY